MKTGILTLSELIEKFTINPARILGLGKGSISEDAKADIMIFDANEEYKVCVDEFKSKAKNSPYDGYQLFGKVLYTIVGGDIVVSQGILL